MKERLLIILAVAVLTLAAAPALSSLLPAGSSTAGSPGVVYADDDPTPTPTPQYSGCQGGSTCGG
ncbi:MAG: hypothetical protein KDI07_02360 [Anaerolineae bacterium]|nr:hypothetical protein [Anaerolineae bacterium]MCB9129796.1 hypothetical protein [Anaerolineales bacterium]MCB0233907.1 hypothetical protein [Anaerolineae bacterium]MCB0239141.1 hypothetical protein [Anaerolineae bacterium]MCB0247395.1 hypothetical protein [Anaerolineae bacterium]